MDLAKKKEIQVEEEGYAIFRPYFDKMEKICHGVDGNSTDLKDGSCGQKGTVDDGFFVDQEHDICQTCFEARTGSKPLMVFSVDTKKDKCRKCEATGGCIDETSGYCESCFHSLSNVYVQIGDVITLDGAPVVEKEVAKIAFHELTEEEFFYMKEINRLIVAISEHNKLFAEGKQVLSDDEAEENVMYLKELARVFKHVPHDPIPEDFKSKKKVKNTVTFTAPTKVKLSDLEAVDLRIKEGLDDHSDMDWFMSPRYQGFDVILDVKSGKARSIIDANEAASENLLGVSKIMKGFPSFRGMTAKFLATFVVGRESKVSAQEMLEQALKKNKEFEGLTLVITGIVDKIEIDGYYEPFETIHTMYDRLRQRGLKTPNYRVVRHFSKIGELMEEYEGEEFITTGFNIRPDEMFIDNQLGQNFNFVLNYQVQTYEGMVQNIEILKTRASQELYPELTINPIKVKDNEYKKAYTKDLKFLASVMIGDYVEMELVSGRLMVTSVKMDKRTQACKPPSPFNGKCPSCGQECAVSDGKIECKNEACVDHLFVKVLKFASKTPALKRWENTDFLDEFFKATGVKTLDEIKALKVESIKKLPGFGDKRAEKVVEDIKKGFDGIDEKKFKSMTA